MNWIYWIESNACCPCQNFTCPRIIAPQGTTSCVGNLLKTQQASSILLHLAYMQQRSLATKNTRLTTSLVTFCSRLCSSSATALACAFSIHSERWKCLAKRFSTKKEFPSHGIWWDSSDSFFPCPHSVYPENHATPSNGILSEYLVWILSK